MKSRKRSSSGRILTAVLASAFLLAACGQMGPLFMPEKHSKKPAPTPGKSRQKKKTPPPKGKTAPPSPGKTSEENIVQPVPNAENPPSPSGKTDEES